MTVNEQFAKDLQDRGLERRSAMELFGRTWKGEMVASLKGSYAQWSLIHAALTEQIATLQTAPGQPVPREWCDTIQAAERAAKTLVLLNEQLMSIVLHPTRPKAQQSARAGAGRKNSDPVIDAEPVHQTPTETP